MKTIFNKKLIVFCHVECALVYSAHPRLFAVPMCNVHSYFSIKIWGKKCALHMAKHSNFKYAEWFISPKNFYFCGLKGAG